MEPGSGRGEFAVRRPRGSPMPGQYRAVGEIGGGKGVEEVDVGRRGVL